MSVELQNYDELVQRFTSIKNKQDAVLWLRRGFIDDNGIIKYLVRQEIVLKDHFKYRCSDNIVFNFFVYNRRTRSSHMKSIALRDPLFQDRHQQQILSITEHTPLLRGSSSSIQL